MPEGWKHNFKMECESGIQKFDSNCKLKFQESTNDTGRHRFWRFIIKFQKIPENHEKSRLLENNIWNQNQSNPDTKQVKSCSTAIWVRIVENKYNNNRRKYAQKSEYVTVYVCRGWGITLGECSRLFLVSPLWQVTYIRVSCMRISELQLYCGQIDLYQCAVLYQCGYVYYVDMYITCDEWLY